MVFVYKYDRKVANKGKGKAVLQFVLEVSRACMTYGITQLPAAQQRQRLSPLSRP